MTYPNPYDPAQQLRPSPAPMPTIGLTMPSQARRRRPAPVLSPTGVPALAPPPAPFGLSPSPAPNPFPLPTRNGGIDVARIGSIANNADLAYQRGQTSRAAALNQAIGLSPTLHQQEELAPEYAQAAQLYAMNGGKGATSSGGSDANARARIAAAIIAANPEATEEDIAAGVNAALPAAAAPNPAAPQGPPAPGAAPAPSPTPGAVASPPALPGPQPTAQPQRNKIQLTSEQAAEMWRVIQGQNPNATAEQLKGLFDEKMGKYNVKGSTAMAAITDNPAYGGMTDVPRDPTTGAVLPFKLPGTASLRPTPIMSTSANGDVVATNRTDDVPLRMALQQNGIRPIMNANGTVNADMSIPLVQQAQIGQQLQKEGTAFEMGPRAGYTVLPTMDSTQPTPAPSPSPTPATPPMAFTPPAPPVSTTPGEDPMKNPSMTRNSGPPSVPVRSDSQGRLPMPLVPPNNGKLVPGVVGMDASRGDLRFGNGQQQVPVRPGTANGATSGTLAPPAPSPSPAPSPAPAPQQPIAQAAAPAAPKLPDGAVTNPDGTISYRNRRYRLDGTKMVAIQ
jgi:hypothetical protein